MDFLNIGLSGLALNSNMQVEDEFLMDEVIGNASLMKSMRAAVQDYGTDLPLAIAVLEHCLGRNVYVATSNSTNKPEVITENGNDKEEIKEARNSVKYRRLWRLAIIPIVLGLHHQLYLNKFCKIFPGMGIF